MSTSLVLPSRGKAATVVDERGFPVHLKCSSCKLPVFNSFQTPHGCRLCQTCMDNLPAQEKVPCPGTTDACKDKEEETDICQASCFPDMASRREIGKVKVFCPNKQDGCGTQFQWREIEAHLSSCDFEKVQCDLCGERKLKRDLAEHKKKECRQRLEKCESCNTQVVAGVMKSEHRNLQSATCCTAFTAPCPHCGEGRMSRQDYQRHRAECRQRPTACKFAHLGCTVEETAAKLQNHYRDAADRHLELVDARLRQATMQVVGGTAALAASATAAVAAASAAAASPVGATREAVELERKALNIFAVFKRLQPNVANWAQTTLELEELLKAFGGAGGFKAVLKTMDDKLRQLEAAEQATGASVSAAALPTSEASRLTERMRAVEIRFDTLELTCFDGCLTWKVTGVAARRREARDGAPASLFSPPFFSKRYGHMFRVRLFLNGHEGAEGSHMSVQLVLMQSEYDDVLDWPLVADVTFRLVHARSRSDDVVAKATLDAQRPADVDDLTMCVGVSKFARIGLVEEKFVRNDCLYVETEVEPRVDASRRSRRR